MTKKYKLINHTADFGIHVFGKDAEDLFTNAAFALFAIHIFGANGAGIPMANMSFLRVPGS